MWQIFNDGVDPYLRNVKDILAGHRLARPEKCPRKVYDLMLRCWDLEASNRPEFSEIAEKIVRILRKLPSNPYANRLSTATFEGNKIFLFFILFYLFFLNISLLKIGIEKFRKKLSIKIKNMKNKNKIK